MTAQEFINLKFPDSHFLIRDITVIQLIELLIEYATIKCEDQREICAFEATTTYRYDYDGERIEIVDHESIRNAKNPEM